MVRKPKTEYYVNNKEFLEALVAYKFRVNRAKDAGDSRPIVPNYVGECFLKIATHLSYKPNFVNYMFREDMICDGIENCLQYIDNFNPEKSSNPFAYFTQIIYYAFLRRIQKEKRQLEIKSKILEKSGHQEIMHTDTYDGDMAGMNASYSDMGSIKENIETRMNR
jgi:DNA-directed RNA polymerase specialized sigma24 family protein